MGIKIVKPVKCLYLVGVVKVGEYLYVQVIIWTNTILNHMDTKVMIPR